MRNENAGHACGLGGRDWDGGGSWAGLRPGDALGARLVFCVDDFLLCRVQLRDGRTGSLGPDDAGSADDARAPRREARPHAVTLWLEHDRMLARPNHDAVDEAQKMSPRVEC